MAFTSPWRHPRYEKWRPKLVSALTPSTIRVECGSKSLIKPEQQKALFEVEKGQAVHNEKLLFILEEGTAESFKTFLDIIRQTEPLFNFRQMLCELNAISHPALYDATNPWVHVGFEGRGLHDFILSLPVAEIRPALVEKGLVPAPAEIGDDTPGLDEDFQLPANQGAPQLTLADLGHLKAGGRASLGAFVGILSKLGYHERIEDFVSLYSPAPAAV
eukprot:scpid86581/ scgid33511/ 